MATNDLKKSRQGHLGYLTRLFNELDRLLNDYGNIVRVKEIKTKLNAAWRNFDEVSNEYIACLDEQPCEQQRAIDQAIEKETRKCEYDVKIETFLTEASTHFSTWPATSEGYRAPASNDGSQRSIRSSTSKRSDASERLRRAEYEFEKSRIMEEHAELQKERSLLIEAKKLELELERRIEIAKLEAERSVEEAKNRTRMAQMAVEMARKDLSDLGREEFDDDLPRENPPVPHGSKLRSSSMQVEASRSQVDFDQISDVSSMYLKMQAPKPRTFQIPQPTSTSSP